MQPNDHGSPAESIQSLPMAASAIRLPKTREIIDDPLSQSEASLARRRSNPSAASLYASTLSPPGSRSQSPAGRGSPRRAFSSSALGNAFNKSLTDMDAAENHGDPLNLILNSFVPHVAVYASQDTNDMVKEKGFRNGLWELLRPFGEHVQGRVTVRDSNGVAKAWDDFAVRFTKFGENIEAPDPANAGLKSPTGFPATNGLSAAHNSSRRNSTTGNRIAEVEKLVDKHLSYAEESFMGIAHPTTPTQRDSEEDTSPYYTLYLRRLLSGIPLSCHETFGHPVAAVIAISSRNPKPIETLRKLYADTAQGDDRLPEWVDPDYLRYYVLVHDEESGDITKSMALFEQMKRHLGLHCHLLRIRSSQSAETDDDSMPLPRSEWMTASEELEDIQRSDMGEVFEDLTRYIFESDATAIRTFIREMVTQSIVPTMERNISLWNDQVASRRRGISGRFMSLSKRWTAFGSSSRNSAGGSGSGSSNYDPQGFYRPETQEAIMRKLADFAFMLRDWKLAMSTYELLRSDFANDKAWRYHAAANEMAVFSLLIMPQNMSSKTRLDTINQMLEQAFYSYHTRCSAGYGALRCLALGLELLRLRGGSAVDEAVRWGMRLLETNLVGPIGDALIKERMAVCCATKQGAGSMAWGSWRRKSALWSVLAAEAWINQAKYIQAQRCLNEARKSYSMLQSDNGISGFALASEYMAQLQHRLKDGLTMGQMEDEDSSLMAEEDVEILADHERDAMSRRRSRRVSMIGSAAIPNTGLETAPLRGQEEKDEDESSKTTSDHHFG